MALWRLSWLSEWNYFSNSESLCHCDASHQVLAQSDLWFGRRCRLKNFKMATTAAILDIRTPILSILNLCVTVMPAIKFWLNPPYGLGGDVLWRISRWQPWPPSWLSGQNHFSNFESLCHCDASHQVSPHWDMVWRPSWISERNDFSNSESLCHCDASHHVLAQLDLQFGKRCRLKNFKTAAAPWWPSWISEQNDFSILNLCVTVMPSIKFWLNPTYGLGDFIWWISRWPPYQPSWLSERNNFSNSESLCLCDPYFHQRTYPN